MNFKDKKTSINLWLDIGLLLILLLAFEQHATGFTVHEWLGIAIGITSIIHILLHWRWISCTTRNFFRKMTSGNRFKLILDALIFICFSTIIFTGLMISRSVLPWLGIKTVETPFWRWLHFNSVDLTLLLVAVHIALSWKWIAHATTQYIVSPVKRIIKRDTANVPGFQVITTSKPFMLKPAIKYFLNALMILFIASIISLAWYGISSTTFAETRRPENHHKQLREWDTRTSPGQDAINPGHHHRRNNHIERYESFNEHHGEDQFFILRAIPGMIKHLAFISIVMGIIVITGNKINKSADKNREKEMQ